MPPSVNVPHAAMRSFKDLPPSAYYLSPAWYGTGQHRVGNAVQRLVDLLTHLLANVPSRIKAL
jgi:hypothetical protein